MNEHDATVPKRALDVRSQITEPATLVDALVRISGGLAEVVVDIALAFGTMFPSIVVV